ncbi:pYEATS domain-containing protein [Zavarzinia sp.]|uniref:pYEATS domain-containing protein n=1 Tax=Zavarzinia sp. TaxID=2027920 RepID=UPI00356A8868
MDAILQSCQLVIASVADVGSFFKSLLELNISWSIIVLFSIIILRKRIVGILDVLIRRLKYGSVIKFGNFEIGAVPIMNSNSSISGNKFVEFKNDENSEMGDERGVIYNESRNIFVCHRISISKSDNQLYDIDIYCITHKNGTLSIVKDVSYFLGSQWKNKIIIANNRHNGFAIRISAYGPVLVLAKLRFSDDTEFLQYRYVDFEGAYLLHGNAEGSIK